MGKISSGDKRFKIDWEQQGRYIPNHPNFLPHGQLSSSRDDSLSVDVLLSFQYALLDRIPNALRGITCDWNDSEIMAHCYFDGKISEGNENLMLILRMDLENVFPEHQVSVECFREDVPINLNPFRIRKESFKP